MLLKEMRVRKFLKEEEKKIQLPDVCERYIAKRKQNLRIRMTAITCSLAMIMLITAIMVNSNDRGTKNKGRNEIPQLSIDSKSYFNNKYELFNFVAMKTTKFIDEEREFIFPVFPEIEGDIFKNASIAPFGHMLTVNYENYKINIEQLGKKDGVYIGGTFDIYYEYYTKFYDKVEIIEFNSVKYLLTEDKFLFFEKDGWGVLISLYNEKEFGGLKKILEDIKFVNYEFVGSDLARGNVFDENKTFKYVLNGKELELSYKYKEINYNLCVEYYVYTDGTNEYMFNKENTLKGYRINDNQKDINSKNHSDIAKEELSKYVNTSLFTLDIDKDNTDGGYYEYRQYVNGLKTNGISKVIIDKNGNITEVFTNEINIEGEIPTINERLFEEQINNRLNEIYIQLYYTLKYSKADQILYSVDQSGDLIAICSINAKIIDLTKETEIGEFPIMLVIKVKDCIG